MDATLAALIDEQAALEKRLAAANDDVLRLRAALIETHQRQVAAAKEHQATLARALQLLDQALELKPAPDTSALAQLLKEEKLCQDACTLITALSTFMQDRTLPEDVNHADFRQACLLLARKEVNATLQATFGAWLDKALGDFAAAQQRNNMQAMQQHALRISTRMDGLHALVDFYARACTRPLEAAVRFTPKDAQGVGLVFDQTSFALDQGVDALAVVGASSAAFYARVGDLLLEHGLAHALLDALLPRLDAPTPQQARQRLLMLVQTRVGFGALVARVQPFHAVLATRMAQLWEPALQSYPAMEISLLQADTAVDWDNGLNGDVLALQRLFAAPLDAYLLRLFDLALQAHARCRQVPGGEATHAALLGITLARVCDDVVERLCRLARDFAREHVAVIASTVVPRLQHAAELAADHVLRVEADVREARASAVPRLKAAEQAMVGLLQVHADAVLERARACKTHRAVLEVFRAAKKNASPLLAELGAAARALTVDLVARAEGAEGRLALSQLAQELGTCVDDDCAEWLAQVGTVLVLPRERVLGGELALGRLTRDEVQAVLAGR